METESNIRGPFQGGPAAACRGGILLSGASLLGAIIRASPLLRSRFENNRTIWIWPITLWVVFPLGAWLGCWLPARGRGRPALFAGLFGLLTGVATSLLAGLAVVACLHSWKLWGLISERHSGGYASYRVSVIQSFFHDL